VCGSELQCVAVCFLCTHMFSELVRLFCEFACSSVFQCVALCFFAHIFLTSRHVSFVSMCVAACCSVLQRVAACCSV